MARAFGGMEAAVVLPRECAVERMQLVGGPKVEAGVGLERPDRRHAVYQVTGGA